MDDALYLNIINHYCEQYNCWINWEKSDIENYKFVIDGKTKQNVKDCAKKITAIMMKKIRENSR